MPRAQLAARLAAGEVLLLDVRPDNEFAAGELLKEMEKAKAGRPPQNRSDDATDYRGAKTLAERGISPDLNGEDPVKRGHRTSGKARTRHRSL